MGTMTRAELIAQGGIAGGNDAVQGFVRTWLDAWLQRTAKSWSWPILKTQIVDLSLPVGTDTVGVGTGYNTKIGQATLTTWFIHRIFSPIFLYTSDKRTRGKMLIRSLLDGDVDKDAASTNAVDRRGMPSTCKVRKVGDGSMIIYPDPVSDKQYYAAIDAHIIPNALGTGAANDGEMPWYPSDRTLIQAVKCACIEYDAGGEATQEFEQELLKLSAMVVDDRDFDGEGPGDNVTMGLDPSVFV